MIKYRGLWVGLKAAWNFVKPNTLVEVRLSCGCVGVLTIFLTTVASLLSGYSLSEILFLILDSQF